MIRIIKEEMDELKEKNYKIYDIISLIVNSNYNFLKKV
jgi:hypothetical protein